MSQLGRTLHVGLRLPLEVTGLVLRPSEPVKGAGVE